MPFTLTKVKFNSKAELTVKANRFGEHLLITMKDILSEAQFVR